MKTIILGGPKNDDGIEYHIEKNLREHGYNVVSLVFPYNSFRYKSFKYKIINFFRKTFLKDKTYKNLLKFKLYEEELNEKLNSIESADYAIIIRSDIYPYGFLNKIRNKTQKMYSYHWDGVDAYSSVKKHIHLYDKFYVFDPNDVKYQSEFPNIKGISNFYFENECENISSNESKSLGNTIYYLGTYKKDRYDDLVAIYNVLKNTDLTWDINLLLASHTGNNHNEKIKIVSQHFSYAKNLMHSYQSEIIVDLTLSHHDGLSFRPFEALAFGRKMITTNKSIKKYDFYNPKNIFIWGEDSDLKNFIQEPYVPISKEIYEKYSFRNWLKNVLEEEDKIPIELPS